MITTNLSYGVEDRNEVDSVAAERQEVTDQASPKLMVLPDEHPGCLNNQPTLSTNSSYSLFLTVTLNHSASTLLVLRPVQWQAL